MVFATISRRFESRRHRDLSGREVHVQVRGGYHPDTIRAAAGERLRIVFRREESSPCSEQVVFPAFGKSATLPQGEDVPVDLCPGEPGQYQFSCAMGMLSGRLIITARGPGDGGPIGSAAEHADSGADRRPVGGDGR